MINKLGNLYADNSVQEIEYDYSIDMSIGFAYLMLIDLKMKWNCGKASGHIRVIKNIKLTSCNKAVCEFYVINIF